MPSLDVSDVLLDPVLADRFTVIRRPETVSSHGRSVVEEKPICDVIGVICFAGPDDLERLPEGQTMGRVLSIVTRFRLRGPSRAGQADQNYQPDLIEWQGDRFVIATVDPYTRYGAGFVQALAPSIDHVDKAPK